MWYLRLPWILLVSFAPLQEAASSQGLKERVVFSNLTVSHGMGQGAVTALFQARDGSHWMGTASGLSRFDGVELTHYEASDGVVTQVPRNIVALAQDVDDALWLGSDGHGLCRFDPRRGILQRFDVTNGLAHNCVTSLQMDKGGSLWVGTRAGLNWLDRKTLAIDGVRIEAGDGLEEVLAVEQGPDGGLWVALARRGIFRKPEGGQWTLMWESASPGIGMALAPDGDLWAHLDEEGLLEIGMTGGEVRLHDIPRRLLNGGSSEDKIQAIEADGFGDVWLGTGGGLLKYVVSEKRWSRFAHEEGVSGSLAEGGITCLLEDRRSLLWAASSLGELSWHHLTRYWFPGIAGEPGGLYSGEVNGFSTGRDGRVWIATGKGLNRFELATGEVGRVPLEGGEQVGRYFEILSVLEDRAGRLWVGTRKDGLAMRNPDGQVFKFFRPSPAEEGSLPEGAVGALFEDHLGQVWAGVMGNGIVQFSPANGGRFKRVAPEQGAAELLFVNDFEGDGDRGAWVATVGGGLWHLDAEDGRLQPLRERIPVEQELPSKNLLDVLRSRDGDLWIGTFGGGLVRLNPKTGKSERFDRWEGRLPDWSACGLVEDHAGKIWVSTAAGLLRIDPRQGGVRRFGIQDGLQSNVFRSRSAQRLADGRLLLGGSTGFNLIDPQRLPAELAPPRPLLAGLELNGEPVTPGGEGLLKRPLALTDELRIPFDPRMRFSLRYGTVYFADEGQVWFRFRMDPLDGRWQKGTMDRRATYQGLKPGHYHFVVQTSRDGRNWNGATSTLQVVILPPWYRTWWAQLLALISLVSASAHLGRLFYNHKLFEQKAEKERMENERNRAEAALARQLQHSMLVEQTVGDFRKGLNASAVFEETLERLARHLGLSRCILYWEPERGSLDLGPGRILAEFVEPGVKPLGEKVVWTGKWNLEDMLHSEETVVLHRRDRLANEHALREWQEFWGEDVASVLAVRTEYEERPNGVLVFEVCGTERPWSGEERHLAESIAGQLGLVLAQFELSEREACHRRELEEARMRADAANKAKGEFLAKMTHELRTPLNAIIGFAEILDKEGGNFTEQREGLDIITSSAEHLLGVINDVLEISKLEAGKAEVTAEEFDLPRMLRSVHGMLSLNAVRKGLRFELVPVGELPATVEVDKAKLRQILVNLLNNAVKFTEKGGVSLRAMARPRSRLAEPAAGPGRRAVELVFEVLDTGPGIAEEEIAGLFQKFVQTQTGKRSNEGTGLGLAIAKGFAELMGGGIDVASRVGVGTLFTVKLPVWEVQRDDRKQPETGQGTPEARAREQAGVKVPLGLRVLVVEDQPVNRLLLRKVLSRVGCVLEEAEDGRQAVEKWESFRPDVILMDECMPVMSGTEATKEIMARAGKRHPAIISLTAYAMAEQREAALAAGCSDFLAKPFKQEELYGMLVKYGSRCGESRKAA